MGKIFKFSNPVTIVLLIGVAFVLVRRRHYRELPCFTAYIVYVAAYTSTSYWVEFLRHYQSAAFYVYWCGNLINQIIAFLVIIEVFRNCVRGHESVRRFGVTILAVIAVSALLVVLILAPYGSQFDNKVQLAQLGHLMVVLQRSIRVIQIGLLLGIFAFSSYLGLSWRNYIFGIALGYGLYACVNLVTSVAWEYLAAHKMFTAVGYVSLFDGLAYKLTLILWMTYLWRADRGQPTQLPPPGSDKDLDDWDDALKPMGK